MILYLCGPMSNMPLYNKPAFDEAALVLRRLGHTVLNPHEISPADDRTWEEALRNDLIVLLMHKPTMALLPGWDKSRGATLEHHVAKQLGFPIMTYANGILA